MGAALRLLVTQTGHRDRALLRLPEIKWSEFHLKCGSWSRALRSPAMILPEVAADLAGIDQPVC